ncbi:MAG: Hsp20/alpha crystallin family protein [Candidatus Pacebacteria bacterium]|nr:Hsp20/alpha crystallin family protein [Candidatus Paceibacterota bacterium]MDD4830679.1 Hsp20/alpha crystallin family protein [Candidatus Paceibacterota bacterium]MDD4875241.1 Hsp20/alpha crystallin family protein [Candidatus Paceibacterota bacterium]
MAFLEKLKSSEEKKEEKAPEEKNEKSEKVEKIDTKRDWKVSEGQLAVDIYETEEELVLQTAIAGVEAESLDISLEKDLLIVKGERKNPAKETKKNYFVQECYFGSFSREVILPREIDPSHTKAAMEEGILTIRMPKIERDKKRRITIEK